MINAQHDHHITGTRLHPSSLTHTPSSLQGVAVQGTGSQGAGKQSDLATFSSLVERL